MDDYIQQYNKKSVLVATVHDSILLDVPPEEVTEMARVVKTIMENLPIDFLEVEIDGKKQAYPIEADVEIGINYNDKIEFDEELFKTFNTVKDYCTYQWDRHEVEAHLDSKKITKEEAEVLDGAIQRLLPHYQKGEVESMFDTLYKAFQDQK